MRHWKLVIVALAVAVSWEQTQAAIVADQIYLAPSYGGGPAVVNNVAQTFTVGVGGVLNRIDMQLVAGPDATESLSFSIMSTLNGIPLASLYSTTIDSSTIPEVAFFNPIPVTSVDVSSAGILVNPGDVLAIRVQGTSGLPNSWTIWATHDAPPPYASGAPYIFRSGSWQQQQFADLGFRTFVQTDVVAAVPEPASLALWSLGAVGFAIAGYRRRKSRGE